MSFLIKSFIFILKEVRRAGGGQLFMVLVLAVSISLLPYAGFFYLKQLLDTFAELTPASKPWPVKPIIALAVVWVSLPLLQNWLQYRQETLDLLIQNHFGQLILGKSSRVAVSYYENPDYFDTLHRAQEEVTYRPTMIVQAMMTLLQGLSGAMVALGVLIFHAWWLAIIFFLSALPLVLIRMYYSRKLHEDHLATTAMRRKAWYLHHILTGKNWVKESRIFQFAAVWITKYQTIQHNLFQRQTHIYRSKSRGAALTQLLETGVLVLALVFFARQTWLGMLTIGSLVLLVQVLQRGQSALQQVLQGLVQLYHHQLFAGHIFTFLHLPDEAEKLSFSSGYLSPNELSFHNVTFYYPGSQQRVLHNVSFTWKRGEVLAVVGQNGSGKTTLVNLLSRFYPDYQGRITADKEEIRHIHPAEWRKNLAVVTQDFGTYHLTVAENIHLGEEKGQAASTKMEQVLSITQADEFIQKWPQGINTYLGKEYASGEELSGGQWQRLAISRALYKEADMLILDEPTSAIDPVVEYELLRRVKELYAHKYLLLITHRVYNLRLADRIVVLEHGEVAESGNYEQLIQRRGAFYQLFQHQL